MLGRSEEEMLEACAMLIPPARSVSLADLQQSHNPSNKTHTQDSISSNLAGAVSRDLADSRGRRHGRRDVLGGSHDGLGGDRGSYDDSGGSCAVGRVAGGALERSAVLRVDDAGRAVLPQRHGDEGLAAGHVERLRGRNLGGRCGRHGVTRAGNDAAVSRCADGRGHAGDGRGHGDGGGDVEGGRLIDGGGSDAFRRARHDGGARARAGAREEGGRAGGRGDHEDAADGSGRVGEVHGKVASVGDRGYGCCRSS